MKNIKLKKLNDLAKIPTRGSSSAAGYDLYAATEYDIQIAPHRTVLIDTGLAFEFPESTFGAIFPRSGLSIKRGLGLANGVAVIDSDYRGNVVVALHNHSEELAVVGAGERIAQLVLLPYIPMEFEEVEELSDTIRGEGGLGSTGKF